MQDSCYHSREPCGLGPGNLCKRSDNVVTLYKHPSEEQAPGQSGAGPLRVDVETLNSLETNIESTKAWKTAVLSKLGSPLRLAKNEGTTAGEILTSLWNWVTSEECQEGMAGPGV